MRHVEKVAELAAKPEVECPSGKMTITGLVKSVKWQDSDYGGNFKMVVEDDRGFRVWGTAPDALLGQSTECGGLKGCRVSFSATVEQSRDDVSFGFYKRPTKPLMLELAPVPDAEPQPVEPTCDDTNHFHGQQEPEPGPFGEVKPLSRMTERQEQTCLVLERKESRESLGWSYCYDVSCRDCDAHRSYGCADTARSFIRAHAGHNTWLQDLGKSNPLTSGR